MAYRAKYTEDRHTVSLSIAYCNAVKRDTLMLPPDSILYQTKNIRNRIVHLNGKPI